MQRRKFKKEKGMYIVNYGGRDRLFRTLHDAWQYIFYLRIVARPYGETVTYHKNTLYPVDSLLPPTVTKTVKFFDLGEEEVR